MRISETQRPALATPGGGRDFAWGRVGLPACGLAAGLGLVLLLQASPAVALAVPVLATLLLVLPRRLPLFMAALFLVMPFQQSLAGEASPVNVSATDCVAALLALALPGLFLRRGRVLLGPVGLPMLLFLGIAALSSATAWAGLDTGVSLARMALATLIAVLIFANGDTRPATYHRCFTAYLVGINVLSAASVVTFLTGGIQGSMYTLGIHKNALGPTYGCGIVVALTFLLTAQAPSRRRAWLALTLVGATAGIFLSLSRGAWVATAAGGLLVLLMTRNVRAFLVTLAVLVPLVAVLWQSLPKEAADYAANVSLQAHTVQTRIDSIGQAMAAFHSSPLFGVGIGLRKQIEPHNVLVLTLGETGLVGLVGFVGMFAAGFSTFAQAARRVRHDPEAWPLVVAGAAVLLVSLAHGMMDVYWRRGVGFMGWSCVGMAASLMSLRRAPRPAPGARRGAAGAAPPAGGLAP